MIEEIWKDIYNFEGLYQVSNFGNVKSLDKLGWNNNLIKGKILKPSNNKGYLRVALYKNGKSNWFYISRLVALCFIPNLDNLPEVNHKNLNKSDNHYSNLEWIDKVGNMRHAKSNGAILCGENSTKCKLTWKEVNDIRNEYKNNKYATNKSLSIKYDISKHAINCIITNKNWYDKNYDKFVNSQEYRERLILSRKIAGEENPRTKLNKEDIIRIREMYKDGFFPMDIAGEFNIHPRHAFAIAKKKTWKHIL